MDNNELKFTIPELVLSGNASHQIEIDHILPDYRPEIMRIIHADTSHYISNKTLISEKLTLDIVVVHNVVYQSYDMSVNTLRIENSYVKGIDLTDVFSPLEAAVSLKTEYCSCKATGKRRIEIRSSIDIGFEVYSNADYTPFLLEEGIEVKKETISAVVLKSICEKTINIKEILEEDLKGLNIIDIPSKCKIIDYRIASGKVVVKGDFEITLMALGDDLSVLSKTITIPFGQILDVPDALEEDRPEIIIKPHLINLYGDSDTAEKMTLEAFLSISLRVYGEISENLPIDAYSTRYEYDIEKSSFSFSDCKRFGSKTSEIEISLGKLGSEISQTNYLYIKPYIVSVEENNRTVLLNCLADVFVIGSDDSKTAVGISKKCEFKLKTDLEYSKDLKYNFDISLQNYSYSVSPDGELLVYLQMNLQFSVLSKTSVSYITSFKLNETAPKENNIKASLTVYYANKGESLFDIGKRYNVSESILREENEIDIEILSENRRLIIPFKA